jgi:hypothetical protein
VTKVASALREWQRPEWNLRNQQCVEPYSGSGWLQRYCWQSITTRKRSDEVAAVAGAVAVAHVPVVEAIGQVAAPWVQAEAIVPADPFVVVRCPDHTAALAQEPGHLEQ